MQISDICKDCQGDCCRRPWMTTEEYTRLVIAIGNKKAQEYKPVFILGGWQFSEPICPGLTDTGCILPYNDRPEACRIYPFVKIPTIDGPKLFLDVSRCRHWDQFGDQYLKALGEINK